MSVSNREIEQRAMIDDLESLLQQSENRRERLTAALRLALRWSEDLNLTVIDRQSIDWAPLNQSRAVLKADGKV